MRRSDNDPLQSFDGGDVDLGGLAEDNEDMPDFGEADEKETKRQKTDTEKKVFTNTSDGVGKSTAGRNAWKERHKKGKFSKKSRKSERKNKEPLGV